MNVLASDLLAAVNTAPVEQPDTVDVTGVPLVADPVVANPLDTVSIQGMISKSFHDVVDLLSAYIPNLLGAMAILIFGWLSAIIVSSLVAKLVSQTRFDQMLADSIGEKESGKIAPIAGRVKNLTFYLIMLFVLVSFFQVLGLTVITEPLNQMLSQIFAFIPRIIGGAALLVVAWLTATVLKKIISTALNVTKLDEKLSTQTGVEGLPVSASKTISDTADGFKLTRVSRRTGTH